LPALTSRRPRNSGELNQPEGQKGYIMTNTEALSRAEAETLFADLRAKRDTDGWGDAFRYEMFAKRIVAAEYGRPDAVEWARQWLADIELERREQEEAHAALVQSRHDTAMHHKADLERGHCGNPYYQAYLDTLEHPSTEAANHVYMSWIQERWSAFHRKYPELKTSHDQTRIRPLFLTELRDYAETHLAERLRKALPQPL